MNKFKITLGNQIIEFATEEAAQQYKTANNLSQEIESFTEEAVQIKFVPEVVTPRQMRVALITSGISLESIESIIDSLPEPDRSIIRVTWEYSTEFQRSNPFIASMAPLLNLTNSQVDDLFILASTL